MKKLYLLTIFVIAASLTSFADVDLLVTFSNTQLAESDILYFQGFYNGTNWNIAN